MKLPQQKPSRPSPQDEASPNEVSDRTILSHTLNAPSSNGRIEQQSRRSMEQTQRRVDSPASALNTKPTAQGSSSRQTSGSIFPANTLREALLALEARRLSLSSHDTNQSGNRAANHLLSRPPSTISSQRKPLPTFRPQRIPSSTSNIQQRPPSSGHVQASSALLPEFLRPRKLAPHPSQPSASSSSRQPNPNHPRRRSATPPIDPHKPANRRYRSPLTPALPPPPASTSNSPETFDTCQEKGCSARVHQPRGRKCANHLKNKARYRPNAEADRKRRETKAAGRTVCTGCDKGVAGRGPNKYCWKCFHMRGVDRLKRNGLDGICPGCLYQKCPNRQFGRENHGKKRLYSDSDEETQDCNDAPEEDDIENNERGSNDEEHAVKESIDKEDSVAESNDAEDTDNDNSNEVGSNNAQNDNKDDNTEEANSDAGNDSEDERWRGWHGKFCLQSKEQGKGYTCRGCLWTECPNRKRGHFDLDYNVWEVFPHHNYNTEQEDDDDEYEDNKEGDEDEDEDEYDEDNGGDEDDEDEGEYRGNRS